MRDEAKERLRRRYRSNKSVPKSRYRLDYDCVTLGERNRPRSIYQYSNMAPGLSGQTSIFGVVFFVSKSLLGIKRQKKPRKFTILTREPLMSRI